MALLEVKNLKKVYTTRFGGNQVQALSNVSFSVEEGEYVAIMGESGSGKTTLLNILASLDKPTSGEVLLEGKNLTKIKDKDISAFRRKHLGFVFQDFNLLDTFPVQDNIFLPLVLSGKPYPEMKRRLDPLAKLLGITELLGKYPYEISGGQKQRAAVADHPDGHPQHPGGQSRGPGAVHQGRRGVPPALPRRHVGRRAVSENRGHPHGAGYWGWGGWLRYSIPVWPPPT